MDNLAAVYGLSIPTAVLGFVVACTAITEKVKNGQHHYWHYTFILLGGLFCLTTKILYILLLTNTIHYSTVSAVNGAKMAYAFLYQMFVPLVYCVFFRTCHIAVIANQPTAGIIRSSKNNGKKLFSCYAAYTWLLVLTCTNITYCVLRGLNTASIHNSYYDNSNENQLEAAFNLSYINHFGVWLFALLAFMQIIFAFKAIRPYAKTLTLYLCMALIANTGLTIVNWTSGELIRYTISNSQFASFVLVEMIGLFGLVFALWALRRHWPSENGKQPDTSQMNYAYVPAVTGQQDISDVYPTTTASSPQSQDQALQPQYQQLGRYSIVQVPISQSGQQYSQYSSYPLNDAHHHHYHYT